MNEQASGQHDGESSIFSADDELTAYDRAQYLHGVRRARNVLFFAGGIMFTVDIVLLLMQRDQLSEVYLYSLIGIDVLILAAFIALGLWTRRKPYTAILTGLILFCVLQIFAMITDPTNIYKGVVIKVIAIVSLVSGMKKARSLQQLENRATGRFD